MPAAKRLLTATTVIIVATLIATAPASGSHLVIASEHTTDGDFSNATKLENVSVSGSGDSAQIELRPGTASDTVTRPADDSSSSGITSKYGITVETDDYRVHNLTANVSSRVSGASTGYILDSNHNVIESSSIQSGEVSFSTELDANTKYYIALDNDGNSYQIGYRNHGFPHTSTHLNITAGYTGGAESNQNSYNIRGVDYDYNTSTDAGNYTSAVHDASKIEQGFANLDLDGVDATVEWQGNDGSGWTTVSTSTYSTDGEKTDSLSGSYDQWRVIVDFQPTTTFGAANLTSEGVRWSSSAPSFNNSSATPSGGETVTGDPVELSIDLSDADFGTVQGDEVTVDWYVNGTLEGSTTHTQNETATFTLGDPPTGDAQWHVEATDDQGHTATSDTFLFQTPDELNIWEETNPDTRVKGTDVNVTVRFYQESNDTVVERSTTDGNVSMDGLPVDEEFIVTVEADGYEFRRVIVDSLLEQQDVFLLPETATSSRIEFELDDRTNQFDPVNTRLYVSRALNQSNDTRYRVIAGDRFGASSTFPVILEEGGRYRLRIESDDGDVRTLGAYTVSGNDNPVLQVGRFGFDYSGNKSYEWTAKMETTTVTDGGEEEDRDRFVWQYSDPEGKTDSLNLTVHERGNASNVLVEKTYTSLGNASYSETLSENQTGKSWVVEINGSRGDEQVQGRALVGGNDLSPGIGLDSWWQQVFAVFGLFILAGAVGGGVRAEAGAIVVCLSAGVLYYMSWLPGDVSAGMILAALFIAVLYRVKSTSQVGV